MLEIKNYIFSRRSDTKSRGRHQLYFYENLFAPSSRSSIVNDEKLTKKKTIWKLLNEIFELDKDANEEKMEMFNRENDIKFGI